MRSTSIASCCRAWGMCSYCAPPLAPHIYFSSGAVLRMRRPDFSTRVIEFREKRIKLHLLLLAVMKFNLVWFPAKCFDSIDCHEKLLPRWLREKCRRRLEKVRKIRANAKAIKTDWWKNSRLRLGRKVKLTCNARIYIDLKPEKFLLKRVY